MSELSRITPVPNAVFDEFLPRLKLAELKILLVVIRQTLGWEDKQNENGRKHQDWISSSQMRKKTGCSERAISTAIESLARKNIITVSDHWGHALDSPGMRKGKTKLFFSLASACNTYPVNRSAKISAVDFEGKSDEEECKTGNSTASFAEDIRKKYAELQQKMRITK